MADVTAVGAPSAFSGMNSGDGGDVTLGLKLDAINTKLEIESTLDDVFEELGAEVVSSGNPIQVPNAIFMKLSAQPTGARTVTVPLLKALAGAAGVGAGTPVGSELTQNLKYATFYYDEYYQAVASENFGMKANDMAMYKVFEQIQPQISKYFKEYRGQRIREALLRSRCAVAQNQSAAHWNQNWFVANTAFGSQPAKDGTAADFLTGLITALDAAGGAGDGANANIDLDYLLALEFYAANTLKIPTLSIGGQETYVVLVPSTQAAVLRKNEAGQLGGIYSQMVRSTADEMKYTGYITRVGKLLLIEDQRYPTLVVNSGSSGVTAAYVNPGNSDSRSKTAYNGSGGANKSFDLGFLLGPAAVCEWVVKPLHYEIEKQNYNRSQGTGAFGEGGIAIVEYDTDSGWDVAGSWTGSTDTRENFGSCVLALSTPSMTA